MYLIKPGEHRTYEYFDLTHVSISYEMNLDRTLITRRIYGYFDLISEMGGLGNGLVAIFNFLVIIL